MRPQILMSILYLALSMGCVKHVYQPALPDNDPANPNAPESPASPRPDWLQNGILRATEQPSAKPLSQETPAYYTCPMHPEIVRSERGRCPQCGMRLVPGDQKETDQSDNQ